MVHAIGHVLMIPDSVVLNPFVTFKVNQDLYALDVVKNMHGMIVRHTIKVVSTVLEKTISLICVDRGISLENTMLCVKISATQVGLIKVITTNVKLMNRRFQVSTYGNFAQQCACAEVVSAAGTVVCFAVWNVFTTVRASHLCDFRRF